MNNAFDKLLPAPRSVSEYGGNFTVPYGSACYINDTEDKFAEKLLGYLFGGLFVCGGMSEECRLCVIRNDAYLVRGAYIIDIRGGITVTANGAEGIANAFLTLKAVADADENGAVFPECHIEDAPYKAQRGVHFYLPPAYLLDEFMTLLDELAMMKYNMIILETGGAVEFDSHPEVNMAWLKFCREAREYPGGPQGLQASEPYWKDSTHVEMVSSSLLKKSDLRRIADHCRLLGIELIPEIQALSHAYYLTLAHREIAERPYERWPDSYCPMCEESYTLYFELAQEIIDVIRPKRVSIGHDEVRVLGECPRCRGKSGHELLSYEINRLHEFYAARGIQIMMWGEMLQRFVTWKGSVSGDGADFRRDAYGRPYALPQTYLAAHTVPNDILMLDWYYSMAHDTERGVMANGFDEIFGNFRGSLIAGWDRRSKSPNVLGAEVSTWCVPSEYEMSFNGWYYELVFSSMLLWRDDFSDDRRMEFAHITENYLPLLREKISGKRRFDGSLGSLDQIAVTDGEADKAISYRFGTIGRDTAERVCSNGLEFIKQGEKLDICGYADSLVFFHAAPEAPARRLTTWNFLDKKPRIPAKYAVDYEDGMCVTCTVEFGSDGDYGVCIGSKNSQLAFRRPDAHGNMLSDIDMENTVNEDRVQLSPMYEQTDPWRSAAVYSCRFAELDTPDGVRTVYASEWKNPCPDRKVVGVRFFDEKGSPLTSELYAVGICRF